MARMITDMQVRILNQISERSHRVIRRPVYEGKSKLDTLLGRDFLGSVLGKTVIDFGCGEGAEAIEMAQGGAKHVIGIDYREDVLETARQKAISAGVEHICEFTSSTTESVDLIISIDAFEHFADPGGVLCAMERLLKPNGQVLVCFGPTWYHPYGGHLFSVVPWAHLIFTEKALIRWRSTFKTDGATRFGEVDGGLNQMTVGKFEKLLGNSAFDVASMELVPITNLRPFQNHWTREFTTANVRCRLVKRA